MNFLRSQTSWFLWVLTVTRLPWKSRHVSERSALCRLFPGSHATPHGVPILSATSSGSASPPSHILASGHCGTPLHRAQNLALAHSPGCGRVSAFKKVHHGINRNFETPWRWRMMMCPWGGCKPRDMSQPWTAWVLSQEMTHPAASRGRLPRKAVR